MGARWLAVVGAAAMVVPASAQAAGGGPATAAGMTTLVSRVSGFGELTPPVANSSGLEFGADDPSQGTGQRVASAGIARFVVFVSQADGLSPDDDDRVENVFRRDRTTGETVLVSRADGVAGAGANGTSWHPVISGDGRYVAFASIATNLVPNVDTAGTTQVYVRDLLNGTTRLVSRADGNSGAIANTDASTPAIDADGSTIAFVSRATNLVAGAPANVAQVYVRRNGASTDLVSRNTADVVGTAGSGEPSVSADGTAIAFCSDADLSGLPGDDSRTNVYVRTAAATDFDDGATTMADRVLAVGAPNGESHSPSISADGGRVAFVSSADDILPVADNTSDEDVYVRAVPVAGGSASILASRDSANANAPGATYRPTLSDDGTRVAFTADAQLTAQDTNDVPDVYRRSLDTGDPTDQSVTRLATRNADDSGMAGGGQIGSITPSGALVVLSTRSRGTGVDGPDEDVSQVYLRSFAAFTLPGVSQLTWVSRPTGTGPLRTGVNDSVGSLGRGIGTAPHSVSENGRYVVFTSTSDELFDGDDDRFAQVYVRDTLLGTTTLVSRADSADGAPGDASSGTGGLSFLSVGYVPSAITPDGRYVAFASNASNLVPGDANGRSDIFVRDLQAQTTTRVSVKPDGTESPGGSIWPAISADGNRIAFATAAQLDPVADTMAGTSDIYVRDRAQGTTFLASRQTTANGVAGNDDSYFPDISADGTRIVFATDATNLAPGIVDGNTDTDVYVRDTGDGSTRAVSTRNNGIKTGNSDSTLPSISADGTKVAFSSTASDLAAPDANGAGSDVFVRELGTTNTRLASVTPAGVSGGGDSTAPVISADGTRVLFSTRATNLSPAAPQGGVLLRDVVANTTAPAARADGADGAVVVQATGLGLSPDGHCAVFTTTQDGLEPGLPAGTDFHRVHLRAIDAPCPAAPPAPAGPGGGEGGGGTGPGGGGGGPGGGSGGGPSGTPPTPDRTPPVVTGLRLTRTRFRVGATPTAVAAARTPAGTTVRFTLSEPSRVTLVVERAVRGRRSGAACVRPTAKLRGRRACTRYVAAGTLRRAAAAGAVRVAFTGRIGRRALRPGVYRLRVAAVDAAGNAGAARTARFRVVAR